MSGPNWHRYRTHALQVMLAEYRKQKHGKQYVEEIEKELKSRGEALEVTTCQQNA